MPLPPETHTHTHTFPFPSPLSLSQHSLTLTPHSLSRRHGRLAPLVAAIDAVIARRRALGSAGHGEMEDRCVRRLCGGGIFVSD